MKTGFLIRKANRYGNWHYDRGPKIEYAAGYNWQEARFIDGNMNNAYQYPTYKAAWDVVQYLGIGIFKIEEVLINDTL